MFQLHPLTRNLTSALRDATHSKEKVRSSAAADLAKLAAGAERDVAIAALQRLLLEDHSPAVRAAAAFALADCDAQGNVAALVTATHDASPLVRRAVFLALGELSPAGNEAVILALENGLTSDAPALRFQALSALVTLGSSPDEHLERGLEDADGEVRLLALRLLRERLPLTGGRLAPGIVPRLVELMASEDDRFGLLAALALSESDDARGHARLCEVFNESRFEHDYEDELAALLIVRRYALTSAFPGLRRRAAGRRLGPDSPTRWEALAALAYLGDEQAKQQILRGLRAWSWEARTQAVVAAGSARLADARALLEAMTDRPRVADPEAVADALLALSTAFEQAAFEQPALEQPALRQRAATRALSGT